MNPFNTTEENLQEASNRINKLETILDAMYDSFFELVQAEKTEEEVAAHKHVILWNTIMEYDVIRKVKPVIKESTAKTV